MKHKRWPLNFLDEQSLGRTVRNLDGINIFTMICFQQFDVFDFEIRLSNAFKHTAEIMPAPPKKPHFTCNVWHNSIFFANAASSDEGKTFILW